MPNFFPPTPIYLLVFEYLNIFFLTDPPSWPPKQAGPLHTSCLYGELILSVIF